MPPSSLGSRLAACSLWFAPGLLLGQPSTSRLKADKPWWYEVAAGAEVKAHSGYNDEGRTKAVRVSARHQFHPTPIRVGLSAWMLHRSESRYYFTSSGGSTKDYGSFRVLGAILSVDAEIPTNSDAALMPFVGIGLAPWAGYTPGTYSALKTSGSETLLNFGVGLRVGRLMISWDGLGIWDMEFFSPVTVSWRF